MRSSSFVTKFSLACAAVVAVAVGCKTSSSNMNGSSSESSDGGMMMSADGGMGGMSSDGGMGSMSGSMSGAQSSMNSGMNSAQGSMNSMADAGMGAMNSGMNSAQSSMNNGMNSASSSMNSGATTAADAARNASGSMGMDNSDGGMSGSSSSSGSMGSSSSASSSSGSSGSSGSSASSGNLSDAQIAGITAAAHKGEIDAAKLARKQSKNAKVKSFAQLMLKQHTMALKTETSLEKKAGITPADSDQSQQITQQNQDTAQKLQGLSGKEFDQAYVQAMVDGHQKVLDTIDNTLIPAAQDPQLKAQLQKERSVVETHLDHAKKLNDSLGGGGTQ